MSEKDFEQLPELEGHAGASAAAPPSSRPSEKRKGPRTTAGKAIASRNSLKHGIFAKAVLLKSESRSEYDSLLNGLQEYLKPEGALEEILVEKLAVLFWRYRRLIATETNEVETGGGSVNVDFCPDSIILGRFPRYEASIDRSFDRTFTQLERFQRMRLGQPVAPPLKVDISRS
jgi:hypothetical protein